MRITPYAGHRPRYFPTLAEPGSTLLVDGVTSLLTSVNTSDISASFPFAHVPDIIGGSISSDLGHVHGPANRLFQPDMAVPAQELAGSINDHVRHAGGLISSAAGPPPSRYLPRPQAGKTSYRTASGARDCGNIIAI
jgi:hypothetical protein